MPAYNLGPPNRVIVDGKPMGLGVRIDDLDCNHVAAVHAHHRPWLSLMLYAVIVAVDVGNDSKVAACSNDSRAGRIGDAYRESHDPTAQRDGRDDYDNC